MEAAELSQQGLILFFESWAASPYVLPSIEETLQTYLAACG